MLLSRSAYLRGETPRALRLGPVLLARNASLTGAVSAGVRKAGKALADAEKRRIREGTLAPWEMRDGYKVEKALDGMRNRQRRAREREEHLAFLRTSGETPPNSGKGGAINGKDVDPEGKKGASDLRTQSTLKARGLLTTPPVSVPYTHAASEFLYGTFAVLAALRAGRRTFHKIYIWCGRDGGLAENDADTTQIIRLANSHKVPVARVAWDWEKMLDKMSAGRPHNGIVLEAGPIPRVSAESLGRVESPGAPIAVKLNNTTSVEDAYLGLKAGATTYNLPVVKGSGQRYPFLLWLDRVSDLGNMGAILRSAYFLGVDAVLVPTHGTAPMNAVTIKNSAGAAELIPLLTFDNETQFMERCQEHGWIFYAATAPESDSTMTGKSKGRPLADGGSASAFQPSQVLKQHPAVLMLGNEGEGLRKHLQRKADFLVSIEGGRQNGLIDSLNVSVAAALLSQRFLSPSTEQPVATRVEAKSL